MDPLAWLIITIVGLVGAIWTMVERHRKPPAVPGKSEVEVKAEDKAKKDTQAAVDERDADVAEAKAEAEKKKSDFVKDLEDAQDRLLGDNDALTEHLKDVGKNVRGGGG